MEVDTIPEHHPYHFVERLKEIKKKIVCRDAEISYIFGLLGQTPMDEPPPALFLHGDTGSGKSLILSNCLELGKFKYAIVNCLEGYSVKIIYESIVNQLAEHEPSVENSFQPYAKCSTFLDFVLGLQQLSSEKNIGRLGSDDFSITIVLDKCEKLRKYDKSILSAFLKLKELSRLKICVIFVAILPWTRFYIDDASSEPIIYYLKNYSQKELLQILLLDKPENHSQKFYENYLNLFLSIFYQASNDVRELKYQARVNFEYYSEPIRKKELTENDTTELWKRSQQFFKKSLKSLYLKMDCNIETAEKMTSVATHALSMELPYYSKYLLIGSYLASFNPASEDKRVFLKNHGKIKKSKRMKVEKVKHHLIGPKPFGLQRLFAIVSSILDDEKFNMNADLFVEVASLVKMNLLTQISEDVLEAPSFKCNVGLQFIDIISKNVQFPIRNYLVDFMET